MIFAVFGWWQLRVSSPIVDLRTTARRPVLTTNLASVGVGFSLFALSLIAPQVLELPAQTGYGLGQSMLRAGLWMAPGGLAMMLSAPLAAKIAARRGPKFTLVIGCLIIAGSYLAGLALLSSPARMMVLNVAVECRGGIRVLVAACADQRGGAGVGDRRCQRHQRVGAFIGHVDQQCGDGRGAGRYDGVVSRP